MEKKGTRAKGELHIAILNDPILVVRFNSTEGELLTFVIDFLVETLVTKTTIVCMIMFRGAASLLENLLICPLG
jgi:hypothetical protein